MVYYFENIFNKQMALILCHRDCNTVLWKIKNTHQFLCIFLRNNNIIILHISLHISFLFFSPAQLLMAYLWLILTPRVGFQSNTLDANYKEKDLKWNEIPDCLRFILLFGTSISAIYMCDFFISSEKAMFYYVYC